MVGVVDEAVESPLENLTLENGLLKGTRADEAVHGHLLRLAQPPDTRHGLEPGRGQPCTLFFFHSREYRRAMMTLCLGRSYHGVLPEVAR